jgi:hypothetical protein
MKTQTRPCTLMIVFAMVLQQFVQAQTIQNLVTEQARGTQAVLAVEANMNASVRWFPIAAKFAPNGKWAVVNLCSSLTPTYCKLVKWEPEQQGQLLPNGVESTGRWSLIAGQDPTKSYFWPDLTRDGQQLAFVVAECQGQAQMAQSNTPTIPVPQSCAFNDGQLGYNSVAQSLKDSKIVKEVRTVSKPAWRPDGQALLYWRSMSTVGLASGRNVTQRDVFEYNIQTEQETPKHLRSVTRVLWNNDATGPFYDKSGESFAICGYAFSVPVTMDSNAAFNCIETDATNPSLVNGISTRNANPFFDIILGRINDDVLVVSGAYLELRNKKSANERMMLLALTPSGNRSNHSPVAIHTFNENSIIVISGTLNGFTFPKRESRYFIQIHRDRTFTPVMFIKSLDSSKKEYEKVIFWPDLEFIN